MTKFPIDWGDGNTEEMDAATSGAQSEPVQQEATESNQIPMPSTSSIPQPSDFNSKHSLGIGHDSNSLNLAEPMAS